MRAYTRREIDVAWPKQQKGITPRAGGNLFLDQFHRYLTHVEPVTEAQKILFGEASRQFSHMIAARRTRLASVSTRLPAIVWFVVIGGSVLNLSLMWLFVVENKRLHDVLTSMLAALLGMLVFLLAVMDFPFRGDYSVGPDSFELIHDQLMRSESRAERSDGQTNLSAMEFCRNLRGKLRLKSRRPCPDAAHSFVEKESTYCSLNAPNPIHHGSYLHLVSLRRECRGSLQLL